MCAALKATAARCQKSLTGRPRGSAPVPDCQLVGKLAPAEMPRALIAADGQIVLIMTVALNIMMAGSLTGANFNPAISLGPMVATDNFTDAWLYVTAPIAGAIAAALIHKVLELLAEDRTLAARRGAAAA
ncbi:MAG: aquaporin [Roseiarcus sp.]